LDVNEFANFPYEIVETTGEHALATWEELKGAGRGAPVVLGEDELENLLCPFDPMNRERLESVERILAAAEAIRFPDDLRKFRRQQAAETMVYLGQIDSVADFKDEAREPSLGEWPVERAYGGGLSVVDDFRTRQPKAVARIALIPTDDSAEIPAYMRWGNWNMCPQPAFHVAALRAWRQRHGAELIGLSADTIELRVSRKPATREEAVELARALYVYCDELIDPDTGSFCNLAASLMASDWWHFWWD
jgi:hypothetical protein